MSKVAPIPIEAVEGTGQPQGGLPGSGPVVLLVQEPEKNESGAVKTDSDTRYCIIPVVEGVLATILLFLGFIFGALACIFLALSNWKRRKGQRRNVQYYEKLTHYMLYSGFAFLAFVVVFGIVSLRYIWRFWV